MAESTLSHNRDTVREAVYRYARYSDPDATEIARVDSAIRKGERWIANTPPVRLSDGGLVSSHRWSWLTPTATLSVWDTQEPESGYTVTVSSDSPPIVSATGSSAFYSPSMLGKTISVYTNDSNETLSGSGTVDSMPASAKIRLAPGETIAAGTYRWGITSNGIYRLPDDFGGIDGECLYFAADVNDKRIEIISLQRMLDLMQTTPSTGPPVVAATRPVSGTGGNTPQRWELMVYPTPDQVYSLSVPYVRLVDGMSQNLFWHPGGMHYSELFEAAAIAGFEDEVENIPNGPQFQKFLGILAAAITNDLKSHVQRNAGRNSDPRVYRNVEGRRWRSEGQYVTYNGIAIPE